MILKTRKRYCCIKLWYIISIHTRVDVRLSDPRNEWYDFIKFSFDSFFLLSFKWTGFKMDVESAQELSCYVISLIFYSTLKFENKRCLLRTANYVSHFLWFDFLRYYVLNSVTLLGDICKLSQYDILFKFNFCIFVSNKISFITCCKCPYAFDRV